MNEITMTICAGTIQRIFGKDSHGHLELKIGGGAIIYTVPDTRGRFKLARKHLRTMIPSERASGWVALDYDLYAGIVKSSFKTE